MKKILSPSISIKQSTNVPQKVLQLLKNTTWGTPGKTLYRHLQTETKVFDIRSPFFFTLERLEKLLCTICLAWRSTTVADKPFDSYYIRYFVANSSISGKGNRKKNIKSKEPKGFIKQFMEDIFNSGSRIKHPKIETSQSLFYAYVESENEQSMNLCSHYNFRSVRSMLTLPFSRFNPQSHQAVRKATEADKAEIMEILAKQYDQYSFTCFEHIFYDENYYVFEENGAIVAGIQANPIRWSITNLPGLSGKLLIKILPHIPYLKRLINPEKFDYSALEGLFVKDGYEWVINKLFESVIADQKHNVALMWFDSECPVLETVRKNCDLGLMNKINSNGEANIIVRSNDLTEQEWTTLENNPAYISCFDLT